MKGFDSESKEFLNIDIGKRNALKRMAGRENETRIYPIESCDLMFVNICPLCNSNKLVLISQVYLKENLVIFETSSCTNCLFTFRSVSPTLDWFKKCWKSIYNGKLEVFNPEVEELRKRRYQEYLNILPGHTKGSRALDIGAAYGTGANLLKVNGWKIDAVEPEISKVDHISKFFNISVVSDSIENFVSERRSYDLIIFTQTLEHVDRPIFVIENIKNLLTPRTGVLYIEIPILENYVNWSDSLYLPHKSNFTQQNILAVLEHSGFEIIDKYYVRQHSDRQDSKDKPWDMGIILKYTGDKKPLAIDPQLTIDDVRKIYRKNWPLDTVPNLEWVLKYNVPHVEQFFQTLDLGSKDMVAPNSEIDFINFKDK